MAEQPVLITRAGLERLKAELEVLVNERRPYIAERIRQARELGDLSENAEYSAARHEQSLMEGRILSLEAMIRNAVVIEDQERHEGIVELGTTVRFQDQDGVEETYTIVGPAEADPVHGRISYESPIGSCLVGHAVGDEVGIKTPDGSSTVKILEIGPGGA